MSAAVIIVALGQAWLIVGLCVGTAFLMFGLDKVDASARGAYGFRPLLLPGLVLLWPLVMWRWIEHSPLERQPSLRRRQNVAHAIVWTGLAAALPMILVTAMALRQHDLPKPSSVRIGPASSEVGK